MASSPSPARELIAAAEALRDELRPWVDRRGGSVEHVLHPLDYAWEVHRSYLETWARPGIEAVLIGMNPGPWGMCQTGVPFGSPDLVRAMLGLSGRVRAPARTHPDRPIHGIDCPRNEVSGQRLWGAVRDCFGGPEPFFARFFVLNYCPLAFQSATGANITPDKCEAELLGDLLARCDRHLTRALRALGPRTVIGVGAWATDRARRVIEAESGLAMAVGTILHPSPASPAANKGWLPVVRGQLAEMGHPWPAPREAEGPVVSKRRRG